MPPKKNFGPCAIENCQYDTSKFRKFTKFAAEKAQNSGTLSILEYIPDQHQLCDRHYLLIDHIHLEVLDDKICIPKQDFLNLVSNIEYLQENQKDEIFEEIVENTKAINEDIENINENNISNKINFATMLQLLTLVIYNQQRKFENNPEYNPIKFKQMLEQNEPKLIGFFDELVEGLIPKTRSFYNQEEAKKSIVSFCYLFAGLRNKFANSYKLDIGLYLALAETSYRGIDVLSNTGLTVSSKTVLRYKQQIVEDHFKKICNYFNENMDCLYTFNLDDYHLIHEIRRPNDTFLFSTKHFATCTAKKVDFSIPILANYNNVPLFNPVNINTNNLCKNLKQIYSSLFDRSYNYSKSQWISYSTLELDKFESIDNLTIHLYEDAILEYKEERSMKDLQLVDFKELELHSFNNYANALKMIINVPSLNNYLNQNVIPIITDWPEQLFIRKIITYLKIQQSATNIPQVYKNFHPIIGPLHVALNSKETALIINYEFFKLLFHFVFELAHKAWQKIKKIILEKFGPYYKDTEYRMAIDLLDNIIPATLDIYAVLFRSENVHSRIRAYTTKYSTTDEIIREAFVIGVGYQDTNFKSFHYHLPALDITVSTKQLPSKVLICGHGYHIICYNAMEERYKYCYDYYETGIKNNIKSFINRLEKGANILTEDDINIDEDNENKNNNNNNNNDDNEVENLNLVLSEKDKIEQEFTDKLVNVLNW
ncbi:hypothetical protein F8M41_011372 [Gigaspora margarita]|uniref:Uncharacterized protein n=1 Tax=Gigaspora margarita TaxID=4874 RepID=A0A8H3X0T8_GIGMA|nr:hypothetical protein F8M41_011372 [Gigaspora margarita]